MARSYQSEYTGAQIDARLGLAGTAVQPAELPTKVSDLENDSNFQTAAQVAATVGVETQRAQAAEGVIGGDVDAIEELIPSQATSVNKLADKAFVNSSIATNTAHFRGTFEQGAAEVLDELSTTVGSSRAIKCLGNAALEDICTATVTSRVVDSETGKVTVIVHLEWTSSAEQDITLTLEEGSSSGVAIQGVTNMYAKLRDEETIEYLDNHVLFYTSSFAPSTDVSKMGFAENRADDFAVTNNDYIFVAYKNGVSVEKYSRYKWVSGEGFEFEFDLNNSSFTAAQWNAINSGITAGVLAGLYSKPSDGIPESDLSSAVVAKLDKVFIAEYGVTTFAATNAAIAAGKIPIVIYGNVLYGMSLVDASQVQFTAVQTPWNGKKLLMVRCLSSDTWSNDYKWLDFYNVTINDTIVTVNATDMAQYIMPSRTTDLTVNAVGAFVGATQKFCFLITVPAGTSPAPVVTWDITGLLWSDTAPTTLEAGKTYGVDIIRPTSTTAYGCFVKYTNPTE